MNNIMTEIQTKLKAPKGQLNKFGGFKYRSCEDIVEALKPHLADLNCWLNITDEIVIYGDRVYIQATATLHGPDGFIASSNGLAREPLEKKGMDPSQVTGAASSYARKYALNGLLAIDDTKDADSDEQGLMHGQMDTKDIDMVKVEHAADFFRSKIDEDQIELNWEIMQAADKRLSNDEKIRCSCTLG